MSDEKPGIMAQLEELKAKWVQLPGSTEPHPFDGPVYDDTGCSSGAPAWRSRRDPLDEARLFVSCFTDDARRNPGHMACITAALCDELALLREYHEASEAHLAATQRASRFDEVEAEKRVDAARAALAAKTKEAG